MSCGFNEGTTLCCPVIKGIPGGTRSPRYQQWQEPIVASKACKGNSGWVVYSQTSGKWKPREETLSQEQWSWVIQLLPEKWLKQGKVQRVNTQTYYHFSLVINLWYLAWSIVARNKNEIIPPIWQSVGNITKFWAMWWR